MKQKESAPSAIGKIFYILMMIIFLIAIALFAYYIFLNLPRDPQELEVSTSPTIQETITSDVNQFYPNMKFNHNQITYFIDPNCNFLKKTNMDFESFRNYCLAKNGVTEDYPFKGEAVWMKVMGKMFAMANVTELKMDGEIVAPFHFINLKCDPEKAEQLRESFDAIQPSFLADTFKYLTSNQLQNQKKINYYPCGVTVTVL